MASTPSLQHRQTEQPSVRVYILLFAEEPCRLLTIQREGKPHLPRFYYKESRPFSPDLCCNDLAETLGIPVKPSPFRVIAKLLPPVNDDTLCSLWNPDGRYQMLLLDTTDAVDLSLAANAHAKRHAENPAELTKVFVVRELMLSLSRWDYRRACCAAWPCTSPCYRSSFTLSNRCAHTLVQEGSEFLQGFVRDSGLTPKSYVERVAWDSSAPIFKIDTDDGWLYMKSPRLGSKEVSITMCISRLFPNDTLLIAASNLSLNCFISKEFVRPPRDLGDKVCARKLARLQLESLNHLDALEKAGVPNYSPPVLISRIEELAASPRYSPLMQTESLSLEFVISTLKRFCGELDNSGVPNTLVHGDFASRNFGVRREVKEDDGLIFYDWESSCLSHPFCDLFNNFDEWSGKEFLNEYLRNFSDYIEMETARRYVEIGKVVGAVVRVCYLMDLAAISLDCDKELPLSFAESCIKRILQSVERWSSRAS